VAKLRLAPTWHPGAFSWVLPGCGLLALGVAAAVWLDMERVQRFCRSRLRPIGWLHLGPGAVSVIVLVAMRAWPFFNYAEPGASVAAPGRPDVYLITFDALRAADVSAYGYPRATTPNLERFARQSFVFDYFFAASNFTTPTTTSIATGRLPWSHRVYHLGGFLRGASRQETLAELLRKQGYYTAMISSNHLATPVHRRSASSYKALAYVEPETLTGMWLRWTDLMGTNAQNTLFVSLLRRLGRAREFADALLWGDRYPSPPEAVFQQARALVERRDIQQPRFVWTHIMPPHDPYWPAAGFRGKFREAGTPNYSDCQVYVHELPRGLTAAELRACYDEMLLEGDAAVGRFLDWLEATGRLEGSIVIISADHGESFEHNWYSHGGPYLFDGLIHVPLFIHLPGQRQGKHIAHAAEQADLAPTVLDLLGMPPPGWCDGVSLKPLMEGQTPGPRYLFSMNLEADRIFDPVSKGTLAIFDDEFKYVINLSSGKEQMFRYRSDPGDERDLVRVETGRAAVLREALRRKLDEVNRRRHP
jgi:arylsulfatase A-like enzyme